MDKLVSKRKIPSLIIEPVSDSGNLNLLSMLEHRRDKYLVIVDNIDASSVATYVLDYAQQEGVDLVKFMSVAEEWVNTSSSIHPLSFELSKRGLTMATRRIYKTFDLAYVTRLVGRAFTFDLTTPTRIRRRRASIVPAGVEIKPKAKVVQLDSTR